MTNVTLNIDFYPPFLVKYLRGELFNQNSLNSEQRQCLNAIADQIEQQTKPPKPAEPASTARVVDHHGVGWVCWSGAWLPVGHDLPGMTWAALAAERGPVEVQP